MSFHVETDHKPLVSLLSSKKILDELSPRIHPFRIRLTRNRYPIARVPGTSLATADALSRAPSRTTSDRDMSDIDGWSDSTSKPSCGCVTCNKEAPETDVRPWQKVGTDLFMYKKATNLLVVDCDNSYIEIAKLAETTSSDVILHLRAIFARHGIPQTVVSDNGPQYASYECCGFSSATRRAMAKRKDCADC